MFRKAAGKARKIARLRRRAPLLGWLSCALLVACTAARSPPTTRSIARPGTVAWSYEVTVAADRDLDVVASFEGPLGADLAVDEAAEPFIDGFSVLEGGAFRAVPRADTRVRAACEHACQVRYRVRLRAAASTLADTDVALLAGDALFAPPSTWLLRPALGASGRRFRFHVTSPSGARFVTGVRPVRGSPDTYEADTRTFDESTFAAFGALRTPRAGAGADASVAEIAVAPGVGLADDAIARWLGTGLRAVTHYFGHFPEDRVVLFVAPGTSELTRGKTCSGGGASVLLRVGAGVTDTTLAEDWVAPHELVHVTFPSLSGGHTWLSEGIASYAEPIARAQLGLISEEKVWGDLVDGLPQGLPGPGDHGLETDDSWGRVYWGGSLYFLLADVGIRERTGNARSLRDAVRAIAATGANVETTWPVERVLEEGDRATGTRVLRELYERLALAPGTEDLPALFRALGVRRDRDGVHFDAAAPFSRIREGISGREPSSAIHTPLP